MSCRSRILAIKIMAWHTNTNMRHVWIEIAQNEGTGNQTIRMGFTPWHGYYKSGITWGLRLHLQLWQGEVAQSFLSATDSFKRSGGLSIGIQNRDGSWACAPKNRSNDLTMIDFGTTLHLVKISLVFFMGTGLIPGEYPNMHPGSPGWNSCPYSRFLLEGKAGASQPTAIWWVCCWSKGFLIEMILTCMGKRLCKGVRSYFWGILRFNVKVKRHIV